MKTWGPDALRSLKNLSGTSDDFLWTYLGPEAFVDFKDSSEHWGSLRTWLPTEELRTLINIWGHWGRFEYLLRTFEEFEDFEDLLSNLRIIWGPEAWGGWGPFVHFLDLLRTLCTFWGLFEDLRTWGSQSIEEFSGPFDDYLWTFWGLFLGTFEDFVRTIWWTFEEPLTTTGFWGRW